jgi:hypothetical protein
MNNVCMAGVVDDTILYHMVISSEKMWFYGMCVYG